MCFKSERVICICSVHLWGMAVDKRYNLIRLFLGFAFAKGQLPKEPGVFFYLETSTPDLEVFVETLNSSHKKQSSANIINNYCQYVMEKTCYDTDPDTGEKTPINERNFINPYANLTINYDSHHRPSESVKPPLPIDCVLRCRNYLIPKFITNKSRQISCTNFRQLTNSQKLFNKDWFDVEEKIIDKKRPKLCLQMY